MTDAIITSALLILGVAYFVMSQVGKLKKKYNSLGRAEIFAAFFKSDWDSLIVSMLVLFTWNIFLFICYKNEIVFHPWFDEWGMYAISLVLGWGGQRLAYKALTTVEAVLDKKIDNINNMP